MKKQGKNSAGLYVHFPFCVSKCAYCDFISYTGLPPLKDYSSAVLQEIKLRADDFRDCSFSSIYFGGGTPSLWNPDSIKAIIKEAVSLLHFNENPEITLEINPGTADGEKLKAFRKAGVNRLSVGVQSLSDGELRTLGRIHDSKVALAVISSAVSSGFQNISADLIYSVPGQSLESFQRSLGGIVDTGITHVSLYELTIHEGTPFYRMIEQGQLVLPSEEFSVDVYRGSERFLESAGFEHYEISNWAKPEFKCVHNVNCWECGYYMGIGVGAHGHQPSEYPNDIDLLGKNAAEACHVRYSNIKDVKEYMSNLVDGKAPTIWSEVVSREARVMEKIYLGLRMMKGLKLEDLKRDVYNVYINNTIKGERALNKIETECKALISEEYLTNNNGKICFTGKGEIVADQVILRLMP